MVYLCSKCKILNITTIVDNYDGIFACNKCNIQLASYEAIPMFVKDMLISKSRLLNILKKSPDIFKSVVKQNQLKYICPYCKTDVSSNEEYKVGGTDYTKCEICDSLVRSEDLLYMFIYDNLITKSQFYDYRTIDRKL